MSKKKIQPKKKPSTALARRPEPRPAKDAGTAIGPVLPSAVQLGEEAVLGALGVAEIKLSAAEEKVLAKPVNPLEVLIKPSGQPYLSHPSYTRWFNEAFGRLGWSIVPVGKAQYNGKTVVMPHMLYIHRVPAAFAYGEQEYWEKNREQSYGDAIEACTASALRRCAKRLGVGLELWDKAWLNAWIEENAVRVTVNKQGESKVQWRRKSDPPFYNEIAGPRAKGKSEPPPTPARDFTGSPDALDAEFSGEDGPKDAAHGAENEPITMQQADRLYKTAAKVKRTPTEIKMWLKVVFGYNSSKEIKRKEYNTILRTIEAPGPLPMREPGEEG